MIFATLLQGNSYFRAYLRPFAILDILQSGQKNTVGLYGDMQGIIGGQIPTIPALELRQPDELLLETEDDA